MSVNELPGHAASSAMPMAQAAELGLRERHQAEQVKNIERRFKETVCRVLNAIHLDRDNYGPLGVNEPQSLAEFRQKITAICKEYL